MVPLSGLSPSGRSSVAALSEDGKTAVGSSPGGGQSSNAFVWTQASGVTFLGAFDATNPRSEAVDVTADGLVVVGDATSEDAGFEGSEAFRWTAETGLEGLGFLDPDDPDPWHPTSFAQGVSADGSIVVGNASVQGPLFERSQGFIWDDAHGMRMLRDVLVNDYHLDLTGWGPLDVEAISADGLAIVGFARNPEGHGEAWLVLLPEPGAVALLATGVAVLLARARLRLATGRS
jgi:uncharacterized membrane protein